MKSGVSESRTSTERASDLSSDLSSELGIHPALARRYRDSDARSGEGAPRGSEPEEFDVLLETFVESRVGSREATPFSRPATKRRRSKVSSRVEQKHGQKNENIETPRLPGYTMLSLIGKGAMGQVYKAKRRDYDGLVAVKVLSLELAERDDFIARFEREAAALDAVSHQGVVSILERGVFEKWHFLSMPYVEGVSLRRLMKKEGLPPLRAVRYARQVAQALEAAHRESVVHRDLKPENILVQDTCDDRGNYDERLILVDFGLAGMGTEDPHPNLTKSRMTMGTPNYMAPEQRTDAKRVGPAADIYALGVILYEMVTGDLPLGRFHLPSERPGLSHLPKSLDRALNTALAQSADKRFRTCYELDSALKRVEKDLMRRTRKGKSAKKYDDARQQRLLGGVVSSKTLQKAEGFVEGSNPDWNAGDFLDPITDFSIPPTPIKEVRMSEIGTSVDELPATGQDWEGLVDTAKRFLSAPLILSIGGALLLLSIVVSSWFAFSPDSEEQTFSGNEQLSLDASEPKGLLAMQPGRTYEDWTATSTGWSLHDTGLFEYLDVSQSRQEVAMLIHDSAIPARRWKLSAELQKVKGRETSKTRKGDRSEVTKLGYGGIFLMGKSSALGWVKLSNGSCAWVEIGAEGGPQVHPRACTGEASKQLSLECDLTLETPSCTAFGEQTRVGSWAKEESVKLGLACDSGACVFGDLQADWLNTVVSGL